MNNLIINYFELPYYKAARNILWQDATEEITMAFNFYHKEMTTALIIAGIDTPTIQDILGLEDGSAYLEELPPHVLDKILNSITTY